MRERVLRKYFKDAKGKRQPYRHLYCEFCDSYGQTRQMPAFTDKAASLEMVRKINELVGCKIAGRSPDRSLAAWVEQLPTSTRTRLTKIGLIDAKRIAAAQPLCGSPRRLEGRHAGQGRHGEERHHQASARREGPH